MMWIINLRMHGSTRLDAISSSSDEATKHQPKNKTKDALINVFFVK